MNCWWIIRDHQIWFYDCEEKAKAFSRGTFIPQQLSVNAELDYTNKHTLQYNDNGAMSADIKEYKEALADAIAKRDAAEQRLRHHLDRADVINVINAGHTVVCYHSEMVYYEICMQLLKLVTSKTGYEKSDVDKLLFNISNMYRWKELLYDDKILTSWIAQMYQQNLFVQTPFETISKI